jgi:hypothetical protein
MCIGIACVAERPAAAVAEFTSEERRELEELWQAQREAWDAKIAAGLVVQCRACGTLIDLEDGEESVTRRRVCCSCENTWLERDILVPLVERLGRKAARKALRRLAEGK